MGLPTFLLLLVVGPRGFQTGFTVPRVIARAWLPLISDNWNFNAADSAVTARPRLQIYRANIGRISLSTGDASFSLQSPQATAKLVERESTRFATWVWVASECQVRNGGNWLLDLTNSIRTGEGEQPRVSSLILLGTVSKRQPRSIMWRMRYIENSIQLRPTKSLFAWKQRYPSNDPSKSFWLAKANLWLAQRRNSAEKNF